jgi:hypothetical protein
MRGLEPPRLATMGPKPIVYTNFTTSADHVFTSYHLIIRDRGYQNLMSFKMTNSHKFCEGKLQVYRQSNCKNWMARFYSEGKHKVFSTKEESLHIAKQVAIDWYEKIRYEQKYLKRPVHTVKFKKVKTDYLEYQKKMVSGGSLSDSQAKSYYFALNGPLKYFNNMDITDIQLKQITEYNDMRLSEVKQISIDHDFVALRAVLK